MKPSSIISIFLILMSSSALAKQEHVILLHGLARTSKSMVKMERSLASCGYHVINIDYPSRKLKITDLSEKYLGDAIKRAQQLNAEGKTVLLDIHSNLEARRSSF